MAAAPAAEHRGPGGFAWIGLCAALIAGAPIGALGILALQGNAAHWLHLATAVVPYALHETAVLLGGVTVFVVVVGTGTAWLVTAYAFPGRRMLEVALLLPLAFPAYVMAYAWIDLMHPIGPLQSGLRALLGIERPAELRLPDLRSLPGAVLVFGLALYPYVYVAARAAFLARMTTLTEAARTLGAGPGRVFGRVALPLAWPAIAAGTSLVLMETLNDVGAAEFLGVTTLTTTVYSTWVNRSDLAGAAQIALAMLAIVLALVLAERTARGARSFAVGGGAQRALPPRRVDGIAGLGLLALGALVVALGFGLPTGHLAWQAALRLAEGHGGATLLPAIGNTLLVAVLATVAAVLTGLVLVEGRRLHPGSRLHAAVLRVATSGYAVPGTVLAVGLLVVLGGFDRAARAVVEFAGGAPTGLLVSASIGAVVLAYVVRFVRLAATQVETGLERIPPTLDQSARSLGRTPAGVMSAIHLPLLRASLAGAALLVFVDCMKELPATLLLRPLNFDTLATLLYGEAARGTYEDGAIAALLIVAIGLVPVAVLVRLGRPPATLEARP
ncbi:Putative 2-aminoethylphosphonate transport system permease protein PhnU [Blastochloris viridis]|uniref:Ferric iron ABC transporter n=1 Tax=Blastochloris viridis TaxID=1079 RepID=A0A0H5BCD7_BLAVI|nr:Putative 2-aminoethylphosphonate transport system permease protein PhnU [Blastochloris viridis]BAR99855.1 ferric iron ABC transporter [Blastochloris viridis]CUU42877.1 Molybdenum transport system permease protein modB [Blastochloris viridis]